MSHSYTKEEIIDVWNMAFPVPGHNPVLVRKDCCGAFIKLQQYGNRNSDYGWEIDHIIPISKRGAHSYANVQPLHWHNNSTKGDGELKCSVVGT